MAKPKKEVKADTPSSSASSSKHHSINKEIGILVFAAVTLFLAIALYSYHPTDPSWSVASTGPTHNFAGKIGAVLADLVLSISGLVGFLIPVILGYWVYLSIRHFKAPLQHRGFLIAVRSVGFLLVFSAGSGFFAAVLGHLPHFLSEGAGGMIGQALAQALLGPAGKAGSILLQLLFFLVGLTLLFGMRWTVIARVLCKGIFYGILGLGLLLKTVFKTFFSRNSTVERAAIQPEAQRDSKPPFKLDEPGDLAEPREPGLTSGRLQPETIRLPEPVLPKPPIPTSPPKSEKPSVAHLSRSASKQGSRIPSIELLDEPEPSKNTVTPEMLDQLARLVEIKLADFSIPAKVVGVCPGPIVTRFELQLAPGMKVSRLSNLSKDLARSLSVISVRIVEVIPGKPYVGLELPNPKREIVRLKEVLRDQKFQEMTTPLLMGLGKDISGKPEFADLGRMPHVLVAGTTGSGKSVGLNAMLLSMLLRATPDQLRLIMIDPKMLELSVYEGIPHLLTPVVTDMNQAANALRWCVKEMDQRYRVMSALGVRNIAGLNEKIDEALKAGQPLVDPLWQVGVDENAPPPLLEKMPYIVVLVDEFADMIMVVGKKVEDLICRLAQKARAAGIHLILATQRPSVDVITGLIKANIPTRIAFQVSSKIDSRTILDQQGAEQLLGYGDMLYLPPGTGVPVRIHGAFVADHEVHHVVAAWRALGDPDYVDSILRTQAIEGDEEGDEEGDAPETDPLYDEAVQLVLETQRASISAVQRRFKIGYNRAARLVEDMEAAGLVSTIQNNGMREVLVKP